MLMRAPTGSADQALLYWHELRGFRGRESALVHSLRLSFEMQLCCCWGIINNERSIHLKSAWPHNNLETSLITYTKAITKVVEWVPTMRLQRSNGDDVGTFTIGLGNHSVGPFREPMVELDWTSTVVQVDKSNSPRYWNRLLIAGSAGSDGDVIANEEVIGQRASE